MPTGSQPLLPEDDRGPQIARIRSDPVIKLLLDTMDGILMITDADRHVLATNAPRLAPDSESDLLNPLARRPGDVMQCVWAESGPDACGSTAACENCGAFRAFRASAHKQTLQEDECLLTVTWDGVRQTREYRVRAVPVDLADFPCFALVYTDISDLKRRDALEQVFFHDVLNTLGGLQGWARMFTFLQGEEAREAASRITHIADQIVEEVQFQKYLLAAEAGTLEVRRQEVDVRELLASVAEVFTGHKVASERRLVVAITEGRTTLATDRLLVGRILVNMVKNAFEATPPGGEVHLRHTKEGAYTVFRVWNPGCIPPAIATWIFQRSFTSKTERGHGLGTYSMKLLGEGHLGGLVSFTSTEAEGTTFQFRVPDLPAGPQTLL